MNLFYLSFYQHAYLSSTEDINMPLLSVRAVLYLFSHVNFPSLLNAPFFCFYQISLCITFFGADILLFSLAMAITILLTFSSSSSLARLFFNCIFYLSAGPSFSLHPLVALGQRGHCPLDCLMSQAAWTTCGCWALCTSCITVLIACAILFISPLLPHL